MSTEEPELSSRKAKRAKRDAERAEKHKASKRKNTTVAPAIQEDDGQVPEAEDRSDEKKSAVTNSTKKRKRAEESGGFVIDTDGDNTLAQPAKPTKSTQPRKKHKTEEATEKKEGSGKQRFIVFVGNLPYSTTDDSLDQHFAKLKPYTLRHRTDPKTKKSKGFAFVEFDNFDRMKTCLKLYHHSLFDPENPGLGDGTQEEETFVNGRRKKSKGRKINVELTAGGGGKTEARKEKIRVKNVRLEEQRTRRAEAERKDKERKAAKAGGGSEAKEPAKSKSDESGSGMHPSRMALLR